jgi:hypothetical protein
MTPTRQDTWDVELWVRNPTTSKYEYFGIWDKKTGGEVDSDDTIYHPGNMADPISLGGRRTTGNVTLSRLYKLERDHGGVGASGQHIGALINRAGVADAKVSQQPLDLNGHAWGNPLVYVGVLKRVTPPEHDSEASGAAMIELEITITGYPTKAK